MDVSFLDITNNAPQLRTMKITTREQIIKEALEEMKRRDSKRELIKEKTDQVNTLNNEIEELRASQDGMELEVLSDLHREIWDRYGS